MSSRDEVIRDGDSTITFEGQEASSSSSSSSSSRPGSSVKQTTLAASPLDTLIYRTVSSWSVALFRVFFSPPSISVPPVDPESLPPGYNLDNWQRQAKLLSYGRQLFRDTALLTASTYVFDAAEAATRSVRGAKDDPLNKIMGGTAAGAFMGAAWFPGSPIQRFMLTATGAFIGYVSFGAEKTTRAVLLENQQKLEQEMGVSPDKVKKELDPEYLRDLIRRHNQQVIQRIEQSAEGRTGPLSASTPTPGTTPQVPPWVLNSATNNNQPPRSPAPRSDMGSTTYPSMSDIDAPPPGDPDRYPTLPEPSFTDDASSTAVQRSEGYATRQAQLDERRQSGGGGRSGGGGLGAGCCAA